VQGGRKPDSQLTGEKRKKMGAGILKGCTRKKGTSHLRGVDLVVRVEFTAREEREGEKNHKNGEKRTGGKFAGN